VTESPTGELALVMSGGGARAAYQVGLLRWLARRHPDLRIPILTGVSAGAINAAFLATHASGFAQRVARLAELWGNLTTEQVFRVDSFSLARNMLRLGAKLVSGGAMAKPQTHAAVDTAPLRELLERVLDARDGKLPGIQANLRDGVLRAVAITTSSYTSGQSITWVQGCNIEQWERAHRRSFNTEITVDHVMASGALPLFFPAIQIGRDWFGDGGLRLTAPLSPAVHMGADRILAISTRYVHARSEPDEPAASGYPPPALILGAVLNSIFLDQFDADALTMQRINSVLEALPAMRERGFRPLRLLVLRPSMNLGRLANEYEVHLPGSFRFLTRGLGTKETRTNDLLSLLMFQPDYLTRLIELGEKDAEARGAEIDAFVCGRAG
jgi:NTE family protein